MALIVQKPLPDIPELSRLTSLSVDARDHLAKFLRYLLAEEGQSSFSDSQREVWALALEGAHNEIGDCIGTAEWFVGAKNRSRWRKSRKDEQESVKLDKGGAKSAKGKNGLAGKAQTQAGTSERKKQEMSQSHSSTRSTRTGNTVDNQGSTLDQLRVLVSKATPVPYPSPPAAHLLLSVAPRENQTPTEDSGFDIVPVNPGCVFKANAFLLPDASSEEQGKSVLYGLDEWDGDLISSGEYSVQLVGGTFHFKGVSSPEQYDVLFSILRLSVYVHLSLLLEQHFLANSGIKIQFPVQEPSPVDTPNSPSPLPPSPPPTPPVVKSKHRHTLTPSGLLSFISKTSGNLVHRATSIRRRGSISAQVSGGKPPQGSSEERTPRRQRRFSFIPDSFSSPLKTSQRQDESDPTITTCLKSIEQSVDFLSTSIGVTVEPPPLLVSLAEKEKNNPSRILTGDEKAGLTSILGWSERDTPGSSMSGTAGFIRHQEFSVLFSVHIPSQPPPAPEASSISSTSSPSPTPSLSTCGRPRWITYRYYSHGRGADKTLGEAITDFCIHSEEPCVTPGCELKSGKHQRRFIHGGLRIVMDMNPHEGGEVKDVENIELWVGCKVCQAKTTPSPMNDGTYLFSFAKFLEALVYSPTIFNLTPTLCEHSTPLPQPWPPSDLPLPKARLNIVRYFSYRSWVVSFSLSVIEDIFEARVPRLQIVDGSHQGKGSEKPSEKPSLEAQDPTVDSNEEKKTLRREILSWWHGMAEYMDTLEEALVEDKTSLQKALPRLPSMLDPDDDVELSTPVHEGDSLSSSLTSGVQSHEETSDAHTDTRDKDQVPSSVAPPVPHKENDPIRLLSNLRHAFQGAEQALYTQLAGTPISSLNDVRWSFRSSARGATRRLMAWQKKHVPGKINPRVFEEQMAGKEPEWWGNGCHAVPGGNVIVRKGDWGSIIAFTLSSVDFHGELAKMSQGQSSMPAVSAFPLSTLSNASALFLASKPYKMFASATAPQPDPDQDETWQVPESFSAVISRKQHPRDATALLSLRDVLRHKQPVDGSSGSAQTSSILSNVTSTASRTSETQPSVAGKPTAEVSNKIADGEISGLPEGAESVDKTLLYAETGLTNPSSTTNSSIIGSVASTAGQVSTHIQRGKASSVISAESEVTVVPGDGTVTQATRPPTPPPKDDRKESTLTRTSSKRQKPDTARASSFTSSLTNGLTNAMRYVLQAGDAPPPSGDHNQDSHGLPSVDSGIDEQPHIKYDWTIGKRLKFSCTVYYAKQFDELRRRCGLDDAFVKSLSRSANWAAEGGKSKSNFWKTSDDRFIIKTLVNAWNVADLQVLIDLGPSYFRYVDSTAGKPTVLAKLLGFYTVEVRNLENGMVQSKADLLVMENLFYDQTVAKTFDLKGIQGRKVKAKSNVSGTQASKTLFDGEWIEGQQRTLILVRPHSKVVLREAIKTDSDFLSKSNIMDYSLLLGVDVERKQIACGLVDTIGSYTFAKTLEYKAKQGLHSGKDVTVVPPVEYQQRFVNAIDRYFLACPDKWSRSLDEPNGSDRSNNLPSVI